MQISDIFVKFGQQQPFLSSRPFLQKTPLSKWDFKMASSNSPFMFFFINNACLIWITFVSTLLTRYSTPPQKKKQHSTQFLQSFTFIRLSETLTIFTRFYRVLIQNICILLTAGVPLAVTLQVAYMWIKTSINNLFVCYTISIIIKIIM